MRRITAFLLSALLSALLLSTSGSTVRAQEDISGLMMQVQPAFEGHVKYGEWLPVWVEVGNAGADRALEIQIDVESSVGTTTYATPLVLPTNARKRAVVYTRPNPFTRELLVKLVDTSQSFLQSDSLPQVKIPISPKVNRSLLVGLYSRERGPLAMAQNIEGHSDVFLVDVSSVDLPSKAEAMRSLNTIVINDVDTSTLTAEQASTLEEWVHAGGNLVIGGGGNAAVVLQGLPQSLRPQFVGPPIEIENVNGLVDFADRGVADAENGTEAIRVEGPFVVHRATFDEGTRTDNSEGSLIVEKRLGSGSVKYVALSLSESPFDAWAGNTQFLQTLLRPAFAPPDWVPPDVSAQQQRASQMGWALSQLPSLDLPSIRWIGILLGVYILLVGPINYLLLRAMRRLHLAWITIPLLTIAFTAGTFGLGYAMRGTDLILNHIAVIEPSADGISNVQNYVGLFSPGERSYTIDINSDSLVMPMPQRDRTFNDTGVSDVGGDMTIVSGQPSQIRDFTVNQWAMQSFQTEERWEDFGTIRTDVMLGESGISGEIYNDTEYALQDVVVIAGQQYVRLGEIAAGGSTSAQIRFNGTDFNNFGGMNWWSIFNNNTTNGPERTKVEVKRQIAEAVFSMNEPWGPGRRTSNSQQDGILVLGWIDETPLDVRIDNFSPSRQSTALVYATLPLTWPEAGDFTLSSGFMDVTVIEHPTNGGICSSPTQLHMSGGSAVLGYRLPMEKRFARMDQIMLNVHNEYDGQPELLVGIEFYDWQDKSWVDAIKLDGDGENRATFANEQPDSAISDQGEVRVRITADPQQPFDGCGFFDLTVTGGL